MIWKKLKWGFVLCAVMLLNDCSAQEWKRVCLASYPRSGNHWVRYLIEEATGVATGSSDRDIGGLFHGDESADHLPYMFPWGGYCTDHGYTGTRRYPSEQDIIVIKTHAPLGGPIGDIHLNYDKAICLVRNPLDTFYSYYFYMKNLKMPTAKTKNFDGHIHDYIITWKSFYDYWTKCSNVLMIKYEDLYCDPFNVLKKIFDHTGHQILDEDIKRAIEKYPPKGGIYKYSDCFSQEEKTIIQRELSELLETFKYNLDE